MTQVLIEFVRALRASNINVSTAESLDAAATVDVIGFKDRGLLKESLSQVLAKSSEDKQRFSDCFDRYFFAEDMKGINVSSSDALVVDDSAFNDGNIVTTEADVESANTSTLTNMVTNENRAELQMAVANAAREAGVANIRLFTQRGMYMRRILEILGIEAFEDDIGNSDAADRLLLSDLRVQLIAEVRDHVERQLVLYTANTWPDLREEILQQVPLSAVEVRDFKFMQGLVRKLAKRLVALHRRRKKIARRGHLDVRQTIRRNIEYDGLMFDTVWKRKKIDRPKVVAVCDVSGSVANAARFLLLFLYSVTEVLPKVRAFAFSNQMAEITDLFQSASAEDAINDAFHKYGWGSTDYGHALSDLEATVLDDIDHRTTVLILGDGRSNYSDPGVGHLRRIRERARRVLWLNPEPRAFWDSGDSEMRRLGSACDRVDPCRSIQDLERLVSEIMRTVV
ncbi:MAG TPA: VWA containing CoxE family protein [Gammaproteobacteria bacterium]|nr:VWA containing CoxE family protein [Gammaproteobacteria bacterium]